MSSHSGIALKLSATLTILNKYIREASVCLKNADKSRALHKALLKAAQTDDTGKVSSFVYSFKGIIICQSTWEYLHGFSRSSAGAMRALVRAGRSPQRRVRKRYHGPKKSIVEEAFKIHADRLGHNDPASGRVQMRKIPRYQEMTTMGIEGAISYSYFNRVRRDTAKRMKIQERSKEDTTGQCDACHLFEGTLQVRGLPSSERKLAEDEYRKHWDFIETELSTARNMIAMSWRDPHEYGVGEIDGAANHNHILPRFGGERRPQWLRSSMQYNQKMTGILLHSDVMYGGITDDRIQKGANMCVSQLLRAIQIRGGLPKLMSVFVDGGSENWNKTMFAFICDVMTKYPESEEFHVNRMPTGHTHNLHIDERHGKLAIFLNGKRGNWSLGNVALGVSQFENAARLAWSSCGGRYKRVVVETMLSVFDLRRYYAPYIDENFTRYATPREKSLETMAEDYKTSSLYAHRTVADIRYIMYGYM